MKVQVPAHPEVDDEGPACRVGRMNYAPARLYSYPGQNQAKRAILFESGVVFDSKLTAGSNPGRKPQRWVVHSTQGQSVEVDAWRTCVDDDGRGHIDCDVICRRRHSWGAPIRGRIPINVPATAPCEHRCRSRVGAEKLQK